jgi:hypothetical protein
MGFTSKFSSWIKHLVLPITSKVIINSVAERNIKLKRGIRQGNPLSPYLLRLVMDFFAVWLMRL